MVICLEQGADDLHIVQLIPLPPPSSLSLLKFRMVLSFWWQLTQVVLEKSLLVCLICKSSTKRNSQSSTAGDIFRRIINGVNFGVWLGGFYCCCVIIKSESSGWFFVVRLSVLWPCWLIDRKGIRPVKDPTPIICKESLVENAGKPELILEKTAV